MIVVERRMTRRIVEARKRQAKHMRAVAVHTKRPAVRGVQAVKAVRKQRAQVALAERMKRRRLAACSLAAQSSLRAEAADSRKR